MLQSLNKRTDIHYTAYRCMLHTFNLNSMANNKLLPDRITDCIKLLEATLSQPQPRCFPFSFDVSIVYSGSNPMVLSVGEPGFL